MATAAILTIGNELVSGDVTNANGGRLLLCLDDEILAVSGGHLRVSLLPRTRHGDGGLGRSPRPPR